MSPDSTIFAVRRGAVKRKLDVSFHLPATQQIIGRIETGPYAAVEFADVLNTLDGIRYGIGTPPEIVPPSESAVPFIRATDIKDGKIQTDNLLYTPINQPPSMAKCLLHGGEMILVRSGVNTGDCAVVSDNLANSYAAYDLILRFRQDVEPSFVAAFLDTSLGRSQLNILKARSAQPHLNAAEVKSIRIVLPPLLRQQELVAKMRDARNAHAEKLQEADGALAGIDAFLLEALGLTPPPTDTRTTYAVRLGNLRKSGRLDALSHRPIYTRNYVPKVPILPLGQLAHIDANFVAPPPAETDLVPYVGLPECDLTEVREVVERPYSEVRGRSVVKPGNILFARIEPSVFNKKYVFAEDLKGHDYAYTSTEFYVVEPDTRLVNPHFLYSLFFCSFVFAQVKGKTTGSSGRRRLDPALFASLLMPFPDRALQDNIASEVTRRRERARGLRAKAAEGWAAAKVEFERALLGEQKFPGAERPG